MATPLERWVEEQAKLCKPDKIYWCDGSDEEARRIVEIGIIEEEISGHPVFHKLNGRSYPNAYLHRSHPTDVARAEQLTFICHPDKDAVGPNNNWMAPDEAKKKMRKLSDGCMKGRTMYVLPYMMGHPDSPYSKACIQLTDISYVAASMRVMTRMTKKAIDKIGKSENFVKGLHSVGDFDMNKRFIMHFPGEQLVWSVGSGYGGNALLGKKCFSLRIASWLGKQEGWLAEHMVIMGIEDPKGRITYITAALPSACGKTNLAMLKSTLPGYKIWTLGDDIAWLNIGPDGRLWAINPEAGFFGVAPGTSFKTNPNMMHAITKGEFYPTIFTNVALDRDMNEPWWEGMDGPVPADIEDWQGEPWGESKGTKAAHPNSRFTVSVTHAPTLSPEFDNPKGVPISAILFGGKRTTTIPLVMEGFNWNHGVFLGARMGSETTAAAAHKEGVLRRDPMAMLPFCGYNMGDYFKHWIDIGKRLTNPPKIFSINWFKTNDKGKYIWPGFGDNIRVLKWIMERVEGRCAVNETPAGLLPKKTDMNMTGLSIEKKDFDKLFEINKREWKKEVLATEEFFKKFGSRMPKELWNELEEMKKKIQ